MNTIGGNSKIIRRFFLLCLLVLFVVGRAPEPALGAPSAGFNEYYIGNTEIEMTVWMGDEANPIRGTLFQNGSPVARYNGNGEWDFRAVGLVPGTPVTFRLDTFSYDPNTQEWFLAITSTRVITPGQVRGEIRHDITWSGGLWQLNGTLYIQENARLTIIGGAVVEPGEGADFFDLPFMLNGPASRLLVERATLRSAGVGAVSTGESTTAELVVRDSTLESFSIAAGCSGSSSPLSTVILQNNTGSNAGQYDSELVLCAHEGSGPMISGNQMPGHVLSYIFPDIENPPSLLLENNTFERVYIDASDESLQTAASLTIRGNAFRMLRIAHQSGPLLVEGNRIDGLELQYNYQALPAGSAPRVIRENTFLPDAYAMAGILVDDASNLLIQNNTITCQQKDTNEWGIFLRAETISGHPVRSNQVTGNTITNCDAGLYLYGDPGGSADASVESNTITGNLLVNNNTSLTASWLVRNNLIYNNYFRHATGGYGQMDIDLNSGVCPGDTLCSNTWNVAKTAGTNIVGGPYRGGNYYSDFQGPDENLDGLVDQPAALAANNIDQLPLVSPNAPDLFVHPFLLNPADITFYGGIYMLPVDITLTNLGTVQADGVQVRFSDPSGWSETRSAGSLAPGASTILHLDWELNPLLLVGNGQIQARLTVQADPANAVAEAVESNNNRTASAAVDARPRIQGVQPTYSLAPGFFLENTPVENPVKVLVDWNGGLPGGGSDPYGGVWFDLNGQAVEEAGLAWGAQHTYDMGGDFQASLNCANNTLRLWVEYPIHGGELNSLETALQPTVLPFPAWVEWAILNLPGSDAAFTAALKAPLVEYGYDFKYPEPAFETTWTPPAWLPFLGGHEMGIQETQAEANILGRSDGSGAGRISGQTGLELAALQATGSLYGQGDAQFTCGESLDLTSAEMGFSIRTAVSKEMGLIDLVPGLAAAESWPVVGRIIRWVSNTAKVEGSLTPAVDVVTQFEEQFGQLRYKQGEGTGSLDAAVSLSSEPCDGLQASVTGGGQPYITIEVPANPDYLKEVGINLYYEAAFQAWEFEAGPYGHKINCKSNGDCISASEDPEGAPALSRPAASGGGDNAAWRLIPRDYAGADYALPVYYETGAPLSTGSSLAASAEEVLVSHIYPRPEPALVADASQRLIAYVHNDLSKPDGRGTELNVLRYNGGAWGAPVAVTNDQQPDFSPVLALDGAGRGVLVWERSTLPTGQTPQLDEAFAQSLEIATCTWNGSACSPVATLTGNSLMDRAPLVSTTVGGDVAALWQTSDGTDLLGTAAHPVSLNYAVWDSGSDSWNAPATAVSGLHDVLKVGFAARNSVVAALVFSQDMDGDLLTSADTELFYSVFNGTIWSAPQRITDDSVPDLAPALAYDSSGSRHLVWLRDNGLAWLNNSWNPANLQIIRYSSSGAGFLGFSLSRAANGNLALVWQSLKDGQPDLGYTIFDAANGSWGAGQWLSDSTALEGAYAAAFGGDGGLYLAYQKVDLSTTSRTFDLPGGGSYTVDHLPVQGQSDLAFLSHNVGRDLYIENLTISHSNADLIPGQVVTIQATLHNSGDLRLDSVQAAFYTDEAQIGSTQTVASIQAGGSTIVSVDWTVPVTDVPVTLSARADPAGAVNETDETNNEVSRSALLPDLAVELFTASYAPGQVQVSARLQNLGVTTAPAGAMLRIRSGDPVTGVERALIALDQNLAPGQLHTITLALDNPTAWAQPVETLWFVVDADGMLEEASEDNNRQSLPLHLLPDLSVTAADGVQNNGAVHVTVHNDGLTASEAVLVQAWLDAGGQSVHYSTNLPSIPPGGSTVFQFPAPEKGGTVFIKLDPQNQLAEINEGNNLAVLHLAELMKIYLPFIRR